jgi:hypothetical protein
MKQYIPDPYVCGLKNKFKGFGAKQGKKNKSLGRMPGDFGYYEQGILPKGLISETEEILFTTSFGRILAMTGLFIIPFLNIILFTAQTEGGFVHQDWCKFRRIDHG